MERNRIPIVWLESSNLVDYLSNHWFMGKLEPETMVKLPSKMGLQPVNMVKGCVATTVRRRVYHAWHEPSQRPNAKQFAVGEHVLPKTKSLSEKKVPPKSRVHHHRVQSCMFFFLDSCISFLIIVNQAELKLIHVEVMGFSLAILPDTWPSGHQSRRPGI